MQSPQICSAVFIFFFFTDMAACISVSVLCKDTRIAVQVRTNRPFNGRIYALGRSETCNIDVVNSDLFRLDLTMVGQDCNTQSVVSSLTTIAHCPFLEHILIHCHFRRVYTPTLSCCNTTAWSWQRRIRSTKWNAHTTWAQRTSHLEWYQSGKCLHAYTIQSILTGQVEPLNVPYKLFTHVPWSFNKKTDFIHTWKNTGPNISTLHRKCLQLDSQHVMNVMCTTNCNYLLCM